MQIPGASFIEAAVDNLKSVPQTQLDKQVKELGEALGGQTKDFTDGYNLGLQVARFMISSNTEVQLKGVKTGDVL